MSCTCEDLAIQQGKTFRKVVRWETTPIVYREISSIAKSAPIYIGCASHGIPDGWRAAIVSVKGMSQANAKNTPPRDSDYYPVTVVDANTIEFNNINASEFSDYKSGGYIQFNTPVDLAGYTARLIVKQNIGGTALLSLTTENGGIVIDNTSRKISLYISASDTEGFTWTKGIYELEMISSGGDVTSLLRGNVTVTKEIAS